MQYPLVKHELIQLLYQTHGITAYAVIRGFCVVTLSIAEVEASLQQIDYEAQKRIPFYQHKEKIEVYQK